MLASGCSVTIPPKVYRTGELTIRVYQSPDAMLKDMPDVFGYVAQAGFKAHGWYDKKTKTIYTIRSMSVLIHELRHYLEPSWQHGLTSTWPE